MEKRTTDRFDLGQLSEDVRGFHTQFLAYARSAAAAVRQQYGLGHADIDAHFVDNRRFNAFARTDGSNHTVGLHICMPSLLHFCFNNFLRQPDVLPNLGDASAETLYRERFDKGIPWMFPPDTTTPEAIMFLPGASRPSDDKRANAAVAMTELATAFCVFHEVGHLAGGHTGFAALNFEGGQVSEFMRMPFMLTRVIEGNRLLQVWEREADLMAIVMAMSFVRTDPETRHRFADAFGVATPITAELSEAASTFANVESMESDYGLFAQLLFTVKILFLYLAQISDELHTNDAHPHPIVRATYVHAALRQTAVDDLGLDEQRLDAELDAATHLADAVWMRICPPPPLYMKQESASALADAVQAEIESLESSHRRLQRRYIDFAWAPMSAWKERPA